MLGKIFKILCAAIAIAVIGTLGFRLYTLNHYPAFATGVVATETLKAAYADGELEAVTWKPRTYLDENGDFFIHQPIYFPEEKVLTVTVRYNDSLLTRLKHAGTGEDLVLDVTLYADSTERVHAADYVYGYAYDIYSYRRYVFEGVDLANYTNLYLDIYHGEADYSITPYSSLEVYDTSAETESYRLTVADKKALQ